MEFLPGARLDSEWNEEVTCDGMYNSGIAVLIIDSKLGLISSEVNNFTFQSNSAFVSEGAFYSNERKVVLGSTYFDKVQGLDVYWNGKTETLVVLFRNINTSIFVSSTANSDLYVYVGVNGIKKYFGVKANSFDMIPANFMYAIIVSDEGMVYEKKAGKNFSFVKF